VAKHYGICAHCAAPLSLLNPTKFCSERCLLADPTWPTPLDDEVALLAERAARYVRAAAAAREEFVGG